MSESLFQISCPSCESVFAVTDPELIGQIVACPKCGGMILVEAAQTAKNKEDSQNAENKANDETAQGGETLPSVETSFGQTAQEERVKETAQNDENGKGGESGDETASNAEENAESLGRSRGGKVVAGGVALALVGALAFWGARGFNDASTSISETNVEAESGENSKDGENGENGTGGAQDDVGGFAPFAVEERTSDGEGKAEFWPNGAATLENGENAAFGEVEENGAIGNFEENAQDLSVEANGVGEGSASESEKEEIGEVGEIGGVGAIEKNGENASDETNVAAENASSFDENVDGLEDLDNLGGLDEVETLDVEENEAADALETLDEELATGEKLAGSNASTGFNEADFERANQNDDPENADEPAEVDWSGVASTTNPTLQGALPTLRRERKEIDVDARLALPIKSIEFPSSPVAALRILSEFTGVSIVPDLETFVLTRQSTNATLDLTLHDVTAGEALEKIAELLNWEVCKEKDRILIRSANAPLDALVEERFDVADLTSPLGNENAPTNLEKFELPNNLTAETLAALICSTVAPATWRENGGRATLKIDGSTLVVGQNAQNREKIRTLLESLRAVRALEPRTGSAPERIVPEKLGWENLMKKTTFAPLKPLALQNVVEILEKSQKLQVFWDDAVLNEAGVGRDATTAVRVEGGTIDALLSDALEPLNANYLILGEKLIFVTGKAAAENYQTVEIFSLIDAKGKKPTLDEARTLVAEMKQAVAPASWNGTIGESRGSGKIGEKDGVEGNAERGEDAENRKWENDVDRETELANDENEILSETNASEFGETWGNAQISEDIRLSESSEDAASSDGTFDAKKAVVWLDVESSCMIIRQSQPNQRALRRWLSARLAIPTNVNENLERTEESERKE